jgi:hypothetical protein
MMIRIRVNAYSDAWEKLTDSEFKDVAVVLGCKGDELVRPAKPEPVDGVNHFIRGFSVSSYESRLVEFPNKALEIAMEAGLEITLCQYTSEDRIILALEDKVKTLERLLLKFGA